MNQLKLPQHIQEPTPNVYHSPNYSVLDFETTNLEHGTALNPNNDTVLSVIWGGSTNRDSLTSTWGNELTQGRILKQIERSDFLVAHNAKFELQWLKRIGASLENIVVWDTMIAEYVLLGNRKAPLNLDAICHRYGIGEKDSVVKQLIHNGVCPSEIPESWLERYCIQDVNLTEILFKKQLALATELNLLPVIYTRCLLTPVLADIENNGMYLDPDKVKDKFVEVRDALQEATFALTKFSEGINWNSNDQVAEFLYDKMEFSVPLNYKREPMLTASGKRSVGKEALASLRSKTKPQREFLELYKRWNKLDDMMTKYMSKFMDCTNNDGGLLYAQFNQTVTATHRLSSSGKKYKIQFHNFDRTLKPMFTTRHPGWAIEEDDGASLEFRVAGHIGRDKRIISDIREGVDPHRFTASVLYALPETDVTDAQRTPAKTHTFKPLYGGQSGTPEQQRYYAAFREKYPDITATQNRWIKEVLKNKVLITETGLRFYWPSTKVTRTGYITNRESICNYPVQSLATADIIPIALVYQWHKMKARHMQSFIVNTVHDSIAAELAPDEQEIYRNDVIDSFTNDVYRYLKIVYNIDFQCPLGVGCKIGTHWGKGIETKINVENNYNE